MFQALVSLLLLLLGWRSRDKIAARKEAQSEYIYSSQPIHVMALTANDAESS
jgi:hypothetical protein